MSEDVIRVQCVPTGHQLRAARRVASILGTEDRSTVDLRAAYGLLASDGEFGKPDYRRGEDLLVAGGLAVRTGTTIRLVRPLGYLGLANEEVACEFLLMDLMSQRPPTWLDAATRDGELRLELVPARDVAALESAVGAPGRVSEVLRSLGRRFDDKAQAELGRRGEQLVFAECMGVLVAHGRADLAGAVVRVSEFDDSLGYDILAPNILGDPRRLEVKTVGGSRTQLIVFLTRNEFKVGARDPSWRLVVCRRERGGTVEVVGWMRHAQLEPIVPVDTATGSWHVGRAELSLAALRPGLPLLGEDVE